MLIWEIILYFWFAANGLRAENVGIRWRGGEDGGGGYYVYVVERVDVGRVPFVTLPRRRDGRWHEVSIVGYNDADGVRILGPASGKVFNPNFHWEWFIPAGTEDRWVVETSVDLVLWKTDTLSFAPLQMREIAGMGVVVGTIDRPAVGTHFYRLSFR